MCCILATASLITIVSLSFVGVTISFERTDYVAIEINGQLELCITIQSGLLERTIQFNLSTSSLSAIANQDFFFEPQLLSLDFDTSIVCANVSINNDNILEDSEEFLVILESGDRAVDISMSELAIPIVDSSSVNIGFVQEEYSVIEGGNISVCVILTGQIDGVVTVDVSADNGIALWVHQSNLFNFFLLLLRSS